MSSEHKALLLGAGFVCPPAVQALSEAGVHVTVASRTLSAAEAVTDGRSNTSAISLDITDSDALDSAVADADIVISLVPYTLHAAVVKSAIEHTKPVVTTSYISPALWELNEKAKEAGITVLNEIGLDPGIDHLYAVKTIDEVHRAGGKITSFTSYCGALPAPNDANNPLGYKFSWSPRGGLLALLNSAQWYENGKIVEVNGEDLMASAKPHDHFSQFDLVGYPNRDSVGFKQFYDIPVAETVFRGTLRYKGFPEIIRTLVAIGYFSQEKLAALDGEKDGSLTWAQLTAELLGLSSDASQGDLEAAALEKAPFLSDEERERVVSGLRWIGLFSGDQVEAHGSPIDTLCAVLEKKMAYGPGERDMIALQHRFEILRADGARETRSSTLIEYGEPIGPGSRSAMAKLVGLPCAVGTLAVLRGQIKEKGMIAPWTSAQIATLLRDELKKKYKIQLNERFAIELEEQVF
ncbi:saccharopine dehydrogenase (NADP+, L-glutamate-forming) [Aspergillus melleus]|uniref:saccharopine dehydrogenase (NADP+, L-glutamate-forming) n=1 Tax=Aspergillus melleus TaxID=138277 RepID=UPI001E8D1A26|nr:saccharopine dehydrogenase (NADP+, L-glutamate-forming) [Aspergillus melleus]KAH8433924.1 saccharopine dehydrogenase (NADP+, L-glutamate-forming) [Aspergillus melleus]